MPIGKNKLIATNDNVFVLDKRGNATSKELINFNINGLTKHPNKPHLVLIGNDYLMTEYNKYLDEGYEVLNTDLFNKESFYMIEPLERLNEKINYIRDLKVKILNKRGKYLGIGEVFISHVDLRNKIQKCKNEVKNIINEFVKMYFVKIGAFENKKVEELIIGIISGYCEDCINEVERPYKITYKLINQVLIDKITESKIKMKKSMVKENEDSLVDKEIIKKLFKTDREDFKKIIDDTKKVVNRNILKEKKIDLLELQNKKPYFMIFNDKYIQKNDFSMFIFKNTLYSLIDKSSKKKLCIFLSNIEDIEKYEFIFKKVSSNIKIFISINSITENITMYNNYINSFYKTKIFIGDTSVESFKEMMLICKLPFEEVISGDNNNISKVLRKVKNIKYDTGEMLLINKNEDFKVIKYKSIKK